MLRGKGDRALVRLVHDPRLRRGEVAADLADLDLGAGNLVDVAGAHPLGAPD